MTSHMSLSTCASVPTQTMNIASTSNTAAAPSSSLPMASLKVLPVSPSSRASGGAGSGRHESLAIASSVRRVEGHGAEESLEPLLLTAGQFGVALELKEPGFAAVDRHGAEDGLA